MEKTTLNVEGMSCEHCVKSIKSAVSPLSGVNDVEVSLENKTVTITHDNTINAKDFKEAIEDQGYDVI